VENSKETPVHTTKERSDVQFSPIIECSEREDEEEGIIEKEYQDWEQSQFQQQVAEDYQSMNMRKHSGRERCDSRNYNYNTTRYDDGGSNSRDSFGYNGEKVVRHFKKRKPRRATQGDDGIYRDMEGNKLEQASLISGAMEPVRTINDMKRYYKYYGN
jgi:hypothetical protein